MTRTKVLGISGALLVTGTVAATSIGLHGAENQKNVASASSPATKNAADLLAQRTAAGAVNRDLQRPSDPNSPSTPSTPDAGAQKAAADKAAAEKAASDKAASDKAAADAAAKAASDKATADKAASDRAASDKAAADKAASDKAAADKAASDARAARDKAAADRAAADRAAADRAAADRAAAAKKAAEAKAATPTYANNLDGWIKQAVAILHSNGTNVSYNSIYQAAIHESAGNPGAVNGWDSNAAKGTPSIGLLQVIGPTFNAYKLPGHNNIYNPVDNIIAGARYAADRYGSLDNVVASRCGGSCWRGY